MRHDTTGAGLGVVGIAFCLIGFVAPTAVHLFKHSWIACIAQEMTV